MKGMLAARWASESYWPGVFRRALDEPAPPATALAPMADGIAKASHGENVDTWYRQVLEVETDVYDSHPSIAERLAHLGLDPQEALRLAQKDGQPSAAAAYLGEAEPEIVAAVDHAWREDVMPQWQEHHSEAQQEKRELERLDGVDDLSPDDALRRAHLTEVFRTEDEALTRYRELVDT